MLPGLGMYFQPYALALGAYGSVRSLLRAGFDFDLIDAHYLYPDGVAAALLGRFLGRPVVITARGTDVNLLPSYAIPRSLILWAARQARAVVTVSEALSARLQALGVEPGRLHVVRNGVDAQTFRPHSQPSARRALGLPDGTLLLSVGNLVAEKGHELVIAALRSLPGARLAIVGEGTQRELLARIAAAAGVGDRVSFLAVRPQAELAQVYSAADVLVLASSREGWPNVLLEAMACGTPVAAADVGGVREIVAAPEAGRLLPERTPEAIARAVLELTSNPPDRMAVRAYAERFGWDSACRELVELFHRVVAASRASPSARAGAIV
jgi:glycosyltransferase involved in cell wall biosynthesis